MIYQHIKIGLVEHWSDKNIIGKSVHNIDGDYLGFVHENSDFETYKVFRIPFLAMLEISHVCTISFQLRKI